MSLFPIIEPCVVGQKESLPLCREVEWDFLNNCPAWRAGEPLFVTGAQAVLVWAWKALCTPRFKYEIYTRNYGCECEELVGQAYSDRLKSAEAARYVKECLKINPYIDEVDRIRVSFAGTKLQISCRIITIYGEVILNV
ncbi:MAG: DUF2634 domain-containing protein [Hydrogenoanaerobacterium sp.]